MTAATAIAPHPLHNGRRDPHADDHRVIDRRHGDDRVRDVPVESHRRPQLPYLTTVPDCEPPFDDEVGRPRESRLGSRSAIRPLPHPAGRAPMEPSAVRTSPRAMRGTARDETATRQPACGGTPNGTICARDVERSVIEPSVVEHGVIEGGVIEPSVVEHGVVEGSVGGAAAIAAAAPRPHSGGVPARCHEADTGARIRTTADLPAAERSASMLARAVIEVLSGRRPLNQLRVHCAPEVYAGLADRPRFASAALPHLISVRVCEPADGVAEVSATFRRADRVRALAFRIQGVDGRWRMTALQLC